MADRARYRALQLWCAQTAGSFYVVAVASKLFGNPLAQVIDVVLPLQIFLPFPLVAAFAVRTAVSQPFSEQSLPIISMLSFLLSPFAAMVGYEVFAYLYELGPAGDSALYGTIVATIDISILTAAKFAHANHIHFTDALALEGHSLLPQALLAAISLGFALLSMRATFGRDVAILHRS